MIADPYRALSVRQPWADAIVHGGKDIENRSRCTSHRGPTLIHASKAMTVAEHTAWCDFMRDNNLSRAPLDKLDPYARRGGIVGLVDIVDCVCKADSRWWIGPCGYVLANPRPLPFIPCSGTISPLFWTPTDEVQALVRAAIAEAGANA